MNEFRCYDMLCWLKRIAAQYSAGKEHCKNLQAMADDIAARNYRVAFIGEFNRGKSSLINALLGVAILPMDILPMTATVIRVVYGTEKSINVHFKDGRVKPITVEELLDFATKQDAQKEKISSLIEEIIVHFPSVLCRNHIEILDTPGLNENEAMSARTLKILGAIDAAVVVLSAKIPVSLTEQDLILDLIKQREIYHLIFAVNFIDKFDSEEEKETVLNFIRKRLSEDIPKLAEKRFQNDTILISKIEKILTYPDVFGVSALQALRAFKWSNDLLLQQSRLPAFKESLLTLLTKAQAEDIPVKTQQKVKWILSQLPAWKAHEENLLTEELKLAKKNLDIVDNFEVYRKKSQENLISWLRAMDKDLERNGFSGLTGFDITYEQMLKKSFILRLCTISNENNNNETLLRLMREALAEASEKMTQICSALQKIIKSHMAKVEQLFVDLRKDKGFDSKILKTTVTAFHAKTSFPHFIWTSNPIPTNVNLKGFDIMPIVNKAIRDSIHNLGNKINQYLGKWRLLLLEQFDKDAKNLSVLQSELKAKIKAIDTRLVTLNFMNEQNFYTLQQMIVELK